MGICGWSADKFMEMVVKNDESPTESEVIVKGLQLGSMESEVIVNGLYCDG